MRFIIICIFLHYFLSANVVADENISCANKLSCGSVVTEPVLEVKSICESGNLRVISGNSLFAATCDCDCSLHEDVSWFFDNKKNKVVVASTGMLVSSNYFDSQNKVVYDVMGPVPLCSGFSKKNFPGATYFSLEKNEINGAYCFDVFGIDLSQGVRIFSPTGSLISNERVNDFSGDTSFLKKILFANSASNPNQDSQFKTLLNACKVKCPSEDIKSFKLSDEQMAAVSVGDLNDFGFYLWKNSVFSESVRILKAVLERNPERIPAYLNLADALWDSSCQDEAIPNYEIYIEKMRASAKENKIPSRVFDRVKKI